MQGVKFNNNIIYGKFQEKTLTIKMLTHKVADEAHDTALSSLQDWMNTLDIYHLKLLNVPCRQDYYAGIINTAAKMKNINSYQEFSYSNVQMDNKIINTGNFKQMRFLNKKIIKSLVIQSDLLEVYICNIAPRDNVEIVKKIVNGIQYNKTSIWYPEVAAQLRINRALKANFDNIVQLISKPFIKQLGHDVVIYIILPLLSAENWNIADVRLNYVNELLTAQSDFNCCVNRLDIARSAFKITETLHLNIAHSEKIVNKRKRQRENAKKELKELIKKTKFIK
jgi:hypothetical protein